MEHIEKTNVNQLDKLLESWTSCCLGDMTIKVQNG